MVKEKKNNNNKRATKIDAVGRNAGSNLKSVKFEPFTKENKKNDETILREFFSFFFFSLRCTL